MALCTLSIISGTYLGVSVYRIKKKITDQEDLANTKIISIHAAVFTFYMISTFVSVLASGLYSWDLIQYEKYCMADTFNIFCSTVTQAMICYIFLNIDSIQPPVVRGVSEFDEV